MLDELQVTSRSTITGSQGNWTYIVQLSLVSVRKCVAGSPKDPTEELAESNADSSHRGSGQIVAACLNHPANKLLQFLVRWWRPSSFESITLILDFGFAPASPARSENVQKFRVSALLFP
jgi:hypothetical protein